KHGNDRPVSSGAHMTNTRTHVRCIRVTALFPRVDHAVTDAEMGARNVEHRGEYHAACGAVFLPAPDGPPAPCCPECAPYLRRRSRSTLPTSVPRRGRHARANTWTRRWTRS